MTNEHETATNPDNKISTEELAGLVVDALYQARLLAKADIPRAIAIASEEINVQKTFGTY